MKDTECSNAAAINDPIGLHARPAVKMTKLAKTFTAKVEIRADGSDNWINAKSINALMKLRAENGQKLHVRAMGDDAQAAVHSLTEFITDGFK